MAWPLMIEPPTRGHGNGPQLLPIKALHRHDGYVSFALRSGDDFAPKFSIRADALDQIFPEFLPLLLKDSFVSLNGAYCLANRATGVQGFPSHRSDTLRFLCACYADLDGYKLGLSFTDLWHEVIDLAAAGTIPQASIIINSGRGLWLLWLLHDETDSTRAHYGAFPESPNSHLQLYTRINRAIGERLAHLGADAAAHDGARYCRVPGSFRSDTESEISWTLQFRQNNSCSYTLRELADFFAVPTVVYRPRQERVALSERQQERGSRSKGWVAMVRNSLAAFVTLKACRGGGFHRGCRNLAAMFYSTLLHRNGADRADTRAALAEMAELCTPPLSPSECDATIKGVYKRPRGKHRISYCGMADALDVIPEEAETISQAINHPFPAAARFGKWLPAEKMTKQFERTFDRRLEIAAILREQAAGVTPSLRAMKDLLLERGIEASHATVAKDYRDMGLVSDSNANLRFLAVLRSRQSPLALTP